MTQGIKPNAWSDDDKEIVRTVYLKGGASAVQPLLSVPRTIKAICERALRMGLTRPTEWTPAEDAVLIEHYEKEGSTVCVAKLHGRTALGVRSRAKVLGIRHCRIGRKYGGKKAKPAAPKPPTLRLPKGTRTVAKRIEVEATNPNNVKPVKAPPFVDRRFTPTGPVPRVVDSADCRAWARSAA